MHQIMQIDFKNYIFSPLLRGHIPLRHPLAKGAEVLLVLILGAPSFKKVLDLPLPFKHKQQLQGRKLHWEAKLTGRGGWGW